MEEEEDADFAEEEGGEFSGSPGSRCSLSLDDQKRKEEMTGRFYQGSIE